MGKSRIKTIFITIHLINFLLAGITTELSPANCSCRHIRFIFIRLALPVLLLINFAALVFHMVRVVHIPLMPSRYWGQMSCHRSSPPSYHYRYYNVDAFNGDQLDILQKAS